MNKLEPFLTQKIITRKLFLLKTFNAQLLSSHLRNAYKSNISCK